MSITRQRALLEYAWKGMPGVVAPVCNGSLQCNPRAPLAKGSYIARNDRKGTHGFSLIELVAAMTIFSVGVMACVELYSISLRSTIDTQDYTQAVLLAQQVMEETLADGYLSATTDSDDFGEEHPRHSWELEISDTEQEGLMQVHVVVKWDARNGEKQYELMTLHADRDLTAVPDESGSTDSMESAEPSAATETPS